MENRIDHRWPWSTCGPLTTTLWALSAVGWVLLSVTPTGSRLRPDYWAVALTGLAVGCTRFAVQRIDASVQRLKDAAEDSLRNSELVDRVAVEAMRRIPSVVLPERDPPPGVQNPVAGDRSTSAFRELPVFDPCADTLTGVVALPPRLRRTA